MMSPLWKGESRPGASSTDRTDVTDGTRPSSCRWGAPGPTRSLMIHNKGVPLGPGRPSRCPTGRGAATQRGGRLAMTTSSCLFTDEAPTGAQRSTDASHSTPLSLSLSLVPRSFSSSFTRSLSLLIPPPPTWHLSPAASERERVQGLLGKTIIT